MKELYKIAFLTAFVFCLSASYQANCQAYQQWSNKFGNSPQFGSDGILYTGNVVVDEAGNSYLYVEDNSVNSVLKFNSLGQLVWRVNGLAGAEFPNGIGVYGLYYANGGIYFLSQTGITKFLPDGTVQWQWGSSSLLNTSLVEPEMIIDQQNNLIVAWEDGEYIQEIAKVNQNGLTAWSQRYNFTAGADTFPEDFYIACDSQNNVYLSYTTSYYVDDTEPTYGENLIKYDPNGNTKWTFQHQFNNGGYNLIPDPSPNGEVWAFSQDGYNGADTVYKFDSTGHLETVKVCSYYIPIHTSGSYHYYWSGTHIMETDSDLNVLNSFNIQTSDVEQMFWNNNSIYIVGLSNVDTTTIITHVDNNCHLIETLMATYFNLNIVYSSYVASTAGTDSIGNVYLLSTDWGDSVELYKFCANCKPSIAGIVYYDSNQNCTLDSNESGIEGRIVEVTPGPYYAVSNANGSFGLIVPPGNYSMSAILPNYWNATCGDTINVFLDSIHPSSLDNFFGSYPTAGICDVEITMCGGEAVPGYDQWINVNYGNLGTTIDSGWVQVTIDSLFLFNQSTPAPDSISGNSLFWRYVNLQPGQSSQIQILDSIPTYIPQYYVYGITASVAPVINDINPSNNYDTIYGWVLSSFDPNEKSCVVKNATSLGYITDSSALIYTIAFQNTGTDTAYKISVFDTLNPNLDISTFSMLQTTIKNYQIAFPEQNILEWTFSNALLPDSHANVAMSQAFIKFSIKPLPGLPPGIIITNSATIYFDFNPGVTTNTTVNYYLNEPLGIMSSNEFKQIMYVYPNPFANEAKIVLSRPSGKPTQATVYDITGRVILNKEFGDDANMLIERNSITQGIYLLELKQQNMRIGVARIVIE